MSAPIRIPKNPPSDPALDRQKLFAKGMDLVRALASGTWTDHNTHDPGITILELLTYALTDVAYRASFPLEDLFASPKGDPEKPFFPTARQLLPARPLTRDDYRKLVIDLPGVKNAWVEDCPRHLWIDLEAGGLSPRRRNARDTSIEVRGLYRVRVDFVDSLTEDAQRRKILAAARKRLAENRNLCEDFVEVVGVGQEPFVLCASLEVEPGADLVEIEAQALFRVMEHLSPTVRSEGLEAMSGLAVDRMFDGPALDHGFIRDESLARGAPRGGEVRLSDLICILMDIDGVKAVRDAELAPKGVKKPGLDKWRIPVEAGKRPTLAVGDCRLFMHVRRLPVPAPRGPVAARFRELVAAMQKQQETPRRDDVPVPFGSHRDPGRYHSIQNHFPAIYGIGPAGLPSGQGAARAALARQLQAYLLVFDQILADDCETLARVRELFSTDPREGIAYFHQRLGEKSLAGVDAIYTRDASPEAFVKGADDPIAGLLRRSRILDHCIARYGERFHEYDAIMAALPDANRDGIEEKCAFLASVPDAAPGHGVGAERGISSARGLGYDASRDAPSDFWSTDNVSGVERRIGKLLGIRDTRRRDLAAEGVEEEGMLLIENILLRMDDFSAPLLPICVDPDCLGCEDDDPYSYRVHVLLPAYAGRFRDIDFRRFAERVVREEMPAHVLPRICWVDRDDLRRVELAYAAFLSKRAPTPTNPRVKEREGALTELVAALGAAKNVYEPERLAPPSGGAPKFVLTRNRLGREKKNEGDGT